MIKRFDNKHINNNITFTFDVKDVLSGFILSNKFDKIFILTDENTFKYCFPIVKSCFIGKKNILKIKSGEENKSIITLHYIWDFLLENRASRASLLINLGGGVITDLGGFAASTFKRGIDFINIPTSLLAQIDASIGGKTGINYGCLKNEIGIINFPQKIIIDPIFIKTLERCEFISGYAEMIKHALLFDENYLDELFIFFPDKNTKIDYNYLSVMISKSIDIKKYFVKKDPFDKNIRKALNFGHTFGHAFESLSIKKNIKLKHGDAVAQGMICELFLSNKKRNFSLKKFLYISEKIINIFEKKNIEEADINKLIKLMLYDKKNISNKINCTLLENIAIPVINNIITDEEIRETLFFYEQLSK